MQISFIQLQDVYDCLNIHSLLVQRHFFLLYVFAYNSKCPVHSCLGHPVLSKRIVLMLFTKSCLHPEFVCFYQRLGIDRVKLLFITQSIGLLAFAIYGQRRQTEGREYKYDIAKERASFKSQKLSSSKHNSEFGPKPRILVYSKLVYSKNTQTTIYTK